MPHNTNWNQFEDCTKCGALRGEPCVTKSGRQSKGCCNTRKFNIVLSPADLLNMQQEAIDAKKHFMDHMKDRPDALPEDFLKKLFGA